LVANAVTLYELLIAICFFIAAESAYMSASHLKLGFWGHALAVVLGIVIGFGFAWAIWASMFKLGKWICRIPASFQAVCNFGVLAVMGVWIIASGIVGYVLPSAVLRLIF